MVFEVFGESERTDERLLGNEPCFAIGEVVDERERGDELAIFREMAFEGGC